MNERHVPRSRPSDETVDPEVMASFSASQERRKQREMAKKARRSKFMRRVVTPLVIAGAAGGGVAYVATHGGESYHPRITVVQPGETLSEIANKELQNQGDTDPTTQEINEYVEKIANANPDKVGGSGPLASAPVGEALTLPKK